MTFLTDTAVVADRPGLLSRMGASVWTWIETIAMAQSRAGEVARLNAKSDAELAKMGITRDGIIHYVYRDIYYV